MNELGECVCLSHKTKGILESLLNRRIEEEKSEPAYLARKVTELGLYATDRERREAEARWMSSERRLREMRDVAAYIHSIPYCEEKKFTVQKVTTLVQTPELVRETSTESLLMLKDLAEEARKFGLPTNEKEMDVINRELERRRGNP